MIILQDTNHELEWLEGDGIVCFTHKGFVQGELMRSNGLKIPKLLSEKQASKLLLNTLEMKVLDQSDQQWLNEELVPKLISAGLRYQATIIPTSALGAMSIKSVINKIPGGKLETAYFSDKGEALAWLRKQ